MIVARLNIGGVALNVIQTVHALNQLPEMDVLLVHGKIGEQEGDMAYLTADYPIPCLALPSLGRELSPLRDLQTIWALWRLIRQHRPDVVHTHTAKAGWVGRWAAFLAGVPVRVHTFHGHVFSGYFSPAKTRLFLTLERIAARLTTQIITLSEALRHDLTAIYRIAPQVTVIPLGLDLNPFIQAAQHRGKLRHQLGLSADHRLIGVVGRLVPIKNHGLFLAAAKLAHQQNPALRFIIIGDGEARAALQAEIVQRGLEHIVLMIGWVQDVAAIYADLDLVTITSDNEGTPVSLIEAIAALIPVVSTDVGGVRDLFYPDLIPQLVPPQDAPALAEIWLSTLAEPPNMQPSQERILNRYSIESAAQRHAELYRQLLERHS